jgi:hypothetical protein
VISDEEFKNLSREYYALEKIFKSFQATQIDRDTELEQSAEEYTAQLSHFGAEMDSLRQDISSIKKMQWDFKNLLNRIVWTAAGVGIVLTLLSSYTGKPWAEFFHK